MYSLDAVAPRFPVPSVSRMTVLTARGNPHCPSGATSNVRCAPAGRARCPKPVAAPAGGGGTSAATSPDPLAPVSDTSAAPAHRDRHAVAVAEHVRVRALG